MNIWTGLLFLEGAVADPALARELADDSARTNPRAVATSGTEPPAASAPGAPAAAH